MSDLDEIYRTRRATFEAQRKVAEQKALTVSWIRVALALVALTLAYFAFGFVVLWIGFFFVSLAFAWFVREHAILGNRRKLLENLTLINDRELQALEGDFTSFPDGSEFADAHHAYTVDLDIFGTGSLFQRFNRTCTEQGSERLAAILSTPLLSLKEIKERRGAVAELSEKLDFRQEFQAIGMASPERMVDQQQILDWLKLPDFVYGNRRRQWLLILLPAAALLTLAYWAITGMAGPLIVVALTQWAVVGSHAKRTMQIQDYLGKKRYLLEKFAAHFELLCKQKFASPLARQMNAESQQAHDEIKRLVTRVRALDLRLNIFAGILLNSLVLYDLLCIYRLEVWRHRNRHRMQQWFDTIAEADALNSLAAYAFNHPEFTWPELTAEWRLAGEQVGHPLIRREECVRNDIRMDDASSLWIITGANMAGKSTFLRSVGINVVLALTGSVVCAERFTCPVLEVHSGMRNTDSIVDNQSYFYAELYRLQKIVQKLEGKRRMLVLLDEILKGTNSTDKLSGSQALVSRLVNYPCFALIATHDVALAEMERDYPAIRNYHFESRIEHGELRFDYRLKPGVSTSKNATFLMQKMGIIPS
ncbi:MAG TPA: hypothetical protein VKZ86_14080 [Cyclobacteriaceae bacterium]|nr:hypothetical protein [Cyclobacteriaceae bacterium]